MTDTNAMLRWLLLGGLVLGLGGSAAAAPNSGDVLPSLAVTECGEIHLGGDGVTYQPWSHAGRPLLLHFIPARVGMDEANSGALQQVVSARPPIRPLTVTLVNQADSIWGTGALVKTIVEGRKLELPHARMVIDCDGTVGKAWKLPEGESILMLIDASGEVRFMQVGATSPERVQALISEVDALGLAPAP